MPRLLKILLKAVATVLGILIIFWLGAAGYVSTHKKTVLDLVTRLINENVNGTVTIASIDPALIKGFPGVSIRLNTVRLVDSLQYQHKHDILNAREVYLAVNVFSIFSGKPRIQDLSIENGTFYLFTDSSGYSNSRLFKKSRAENRGNKINRFSLRNVQFTLDNRLKGKRYSFAFRKLDGRIKYAADKWTMRVSLNGRINNLIFNPVRGSYAKNKIIRTHLDMEYSHRSHILTVPPQKVSLDEDIFDIGGHFTFAPNSSDYTLRIATPRITFRQAADLLTPKLKKRMADYDLEKPIAIKAEINGRLKGKNDPLVKVNVQVRNNNFTIRHEAIDNSSFDAYFTNEVVPGKPRKDPNSTLAFYRLKGRWQKIEFSADTIHLVNLKNPSLQGKFYSTFPLTHLNTVSEGQTFSFHGGNARVNVLYKAPFNDTDTGERYIYGTVRIDNGDLTYTPRNLPFKNVQVLMDFKGNDVYLRNVHVRSGRSDMNMEGTLINFLNLYYSSPQNILLDWRISSPHIDLSQFLAFLGRRRSTAPPPRGKFGRLFQKLDDVLNQANVHMALNVDQLTYKRFAARNIGSDITLKQSGISLNTISLNHAGGKLRVKGSINQTGAVNKANISTRIENVDVNKLFYAFENFGQKGISYANLKGVFSSNVSVSGLIRDNGQVISRSIYGKVSFRLRNGALLNFEPMQKIGEFAFPNRDFTNITFANLTNTLDIQGSKIHIRPMMIQSSVLNVFVEGNYGISKGTDISMRVPLRNPEKDKNLDDSLKKKRATRGIVLNLRAIEEDGKIKIKLGKGNKEDTTENEGQ